MLRGNHVAPLAMPDIVPCVRWSPVGNCHGIVLSPVGRPTESVTDGDQRPCFLMVFLVRRSRVQVHCRRRMVHHAAGGCKLRSRIFWGRGRQLASFRPGPGLLTLHYSLSLLYRCACGNTGQQDGQL